MATVTFDKASAKLIAKYGGVKGMPWRNKFFAEMNGTKISELVRELELAGKTVSLTSYNPEYLNMVVR